MFGLNYTGLQKRDTYDEIVQIVEGGGGKIKFTPSGFAGKMDLESTPIERRLNR